MIELLDDFYSLDAQNQRAFNGLTALGIQEELLWTALPAWKLRGNDVLGILIAVPLFFLTILLLFFSQFTPLLLFALFTGIVFLAILIDFWQEEQKRRYTFYGISATTIWVKIHNHPLQQFALTDLHRLSQKKGRIISAAIVENTYEEQIIMEQVPQPAHVLTLLQHLQKEQFA
ncbi:MAG: hypothetical protein ACRBFS_00345 [Aureispira sp.]